MNSLVQEIFGDGCALADMHCHLDFAHNARGLALAARARGVAAFSNTVTPQGCLAAREKLADLPNVVVGVGMHPWWVADGSVSGADVALACELARESRFVGEVGLDFAPRREGTFEVQLHAFEAILDACSDGGKVVSIHAVRSATAALDALERRGTVRKNACVLHWFSGTSQELDRACRLGCLFSFGTRMLATKRGRAYARQVPPERRLLETDLPDGLSREDYPAQTWLDDLALADEMLRMV